MCQRVLVRVAVRLGREAAEVFVGDAESLLASLDAAREERREQKVVDIALALEVRRARKVLPALACTGDSGVTDWWRVAMCEMPKIITVTVPITCEKSDATASIASQSDASTSRKKKR